MQVRDIAAIYDSYNCGIIWKFGHCRPWPSKRQGFRSQFLPINSWWIIFWWSYFDRSYFDGLYFDDHILMIIFWWIIFWWSYFDKIWFHQVRGLRPDQELCCTGSKKKEMPSEMSTRGTQGLGVLLNRFNQSQISFLKRPAWDLTTSAVQWGGIVKVD